MRALMKQFNTRLCRSSRTRKKYFIIFLLLFFPLLYKWNFNPSLTITDSSDIESLRRTGWRTVHHATTYFFNFDLQQLTNFKECPESRCVLTTDSRQADAVLFHMTDIFLQWWTHAPNKRRGQVWVLYGQESPITTLWYPSPVLDGYFNWTMTYQRESDIVLGYHSGCRWKRRAQAVRRPHDYLKDRTKEAYIVTSNCHTTSDRLEFIREMQKYMQVDVFGACGIPCSSRSDNCDFKSMAREYKFYLSFENSLCKDYISEKFFKNALRADIVPVVRGGKSRADYEPFVPDSKAFIYADDFSGPAALAQYLRKAGRYESLYRRHMAWRDVFERKCPPLGTHKLACRLCQALHNTTLMQRPRLVRRVSDFWNRRRDCRDRVVRPDRSPLIQLRDFLAYLFHYN